MVFHTRTDEIEAAERADHDRRELAALLFMSQHAPKEAASAISGEEKRADPVDPETLFSVEDAYFGQEDPGIPDDILRQIERDYRSAGGPER